MIINLETVDDHSITFSDGKLTMQTTWVEFGSIFSESDIRKILEAVL